VWRNQITLKYKTWQNGNELMAELQAAPQVPIRYTTDGSNPKVSGAKYAAPFVVPNGAIFILASASVRNRSICKS
jgi:Fn3 associated